MSIIRPIVRAVAPPLSTAFGAALPWEGVNSAPRVDPTYVAGVFSDANYYASADGLAPTWATFSASFVIKLVTLPTAGQTHYVFATFNAANTNGWGYYLNTNGLNAVFVCTGGNLTVPAFALSGGDAGSTVVVHVTCDGTTLRHYVQGVEVGTGTSMAGHTYTVPDAGSAIYVGRDNGFAGISATGESVACIRMSSAVMTPAQIADDAAAIMARTSCLVFPTLPSESIRYVAADVASGGNWHDRDGDDLTLALNGSVTVGLL